MENVSSDLNSIWNSGRYLLTVPNQAGKQCYLKLTFDQCRRMGREQYQKTEWGQEQIIDFVQKLGFLQDTDDLAKVEHFRVVTKVCTYVHNTL